MLKGREMLLIKLYIKRACIKDSSTVKLVTVISCCSSVQYLCILLHLKLAVLLNLLSTNLNGRLHKTEHNTMTKASPLSNNYMATSVTKTLLWCCSNLVHVFINENTKTKYTFAKEI